MGTQSKEKIWSISSTCLKVCISLLLLTQAPTVFSRQHSFFVASQRSPGLIHTITFEESTNYFWEEATNVADSPHSWIAPNFDMSKLYAVSFEINHITTYSIVNRTYLHQTTTADLRGKCSNTNASFVVANWRFPGWVFSVSAGADGTCGQSTSVDMNGNLLLPAASWNYANTSAIQSLEFGRGYPQVFYSADSGANTIWTHAFGMFGEAHVVGRYNVQRGFKPGRIAAHSYGRYIYATMESTAQLVAYVVDAYSGMVRYNNSIFSLIPVGIDPTGYVAVDLKIARTESYLWAVAQTGDLGTSLSRNSAMGNFGNTDYNASRKIQPPQKSSTSAPGYISCFMLDDDGRIVKKMFTLPLSSTLSTGISTETPKKTNKTSIHQDINRLPQTLSRITLAPVPWADEWVAVTDPRAGYVELWQMAQGRDSIFGTDYRSAEPIARLDFTDRECCTNGIWFN